MKSLHVLMAAAAAALVLAAPSQALRRLPHSKPFARMTAVETRDYLGRQVWHDRTAIRWLRRHDRRGLADARGDLRWFRVSLKIAERNLAAVKRRIVASAWPPHHALWMCIHGDPRYGSRVGNEASTWSNQDTGHNGHWGGLQMHPDWGYGTSHHASDDSQWTQEWAAERGYRASGFDHYWLMGQWNHPACLAYA